MDGVQGRLVDAEPLYRRALAIREEALGPEHPDVASVLVGLAQLHRAQGRLSDAEPLYRRAIAIQQKAVGPNHPSVRALVDNLAAVTEQLRRQAEAEATKPTGPGKAAEPAPTPSAPPVSVAAAAPRAPALSFGALRHLLPVLTIGAGAGLLALLLVGGRRPRALALLAGVPLVAGAATHGLHSAASHVLGPATGLALTHLTVSPDGRFIASADVRGRLVIRDTSGVLPDHVAEHGSNRVRAVGFYSSLDDGGDRYFASVVEGVGKGVERFQATATAWQTVGSVSSGSTLAWPIALCWPLSMPTAVYSPRPAAKPVGSSSSFRRL